MKKILFALSFFLFVGTVSATTYSTMSTDVQTEVSDKGDDDKKKKRKKKGKKGKKACAADKKASGCCSGSTSGAKTCTKKK